MRIAIFTEVFLPKIDGITNRLRHTVRCLTDAGHEVLVFAPEGSVAEHAGARVVRIGGLPFPPYPGLQATFPDPRIGWELVRFRPDVVHAVGPVCLGTWGSVWANALRLPLVSSYHTDLPGYLPRYGLGFVEPVAWPLLRAIHNAAHRNLAPSTHTQRELERHGIENVGLWRGGVDTRHFHPKRRSLAMRARLGGGDPDGPILLYVGRLAPEKGIETLGWALDRLPGVRLALVGDGPAHPMLERVFADDDVAFLGFLSGDELAQAFASADVFVMPSTTETLGFVVMEAMASGLPVVAADAGGIPDMVRHGENGLLYDPEERGQLTAALRRVLGHRGQRRLLAEQARKSAEGATWRRETERLLAHYEEAVRSQRAASWVGRVRHALSV